METTAGRLAYRGARSRSWTARTVVRIRRTPIFITFCLLVIAVFILTALLADLISPMDPLKQYLRYRLSPPYWLAEEIETGQPLYFLGSDEVGRDVLSRTIHGSRVSLIVGFAAVAVGGIFGGLMGLISGYFGRYVDEAIMMVADMQLAFPLVLLAIAVIAVVGPSFTNMVILVGISQWVTFARIVRAQALSIKEKEFVEAIRCLGGNDFRILFRHILPNTVAPLIVLATLVLARVIILESTLSFLGLGLQPPTPTWGWMLGAGRQYLDTAWWIATFPGLFLMAVTLSVSRIGDWLRDVLDPTLRTG